MTLLIDPHGALVAQVTGEGAHPLSGVQLGGPTRPGPGARLRDLVRSRAAARSARDVMGRATTPDPRMARIADKIVGNPTRIG
jgi:hypothetical protein